MKLRLLRPAWAAVVFSIGLYGWAQQPAARLAGPITGESTTVLPHSRPPRAVPANDIGVLPPSTPINGITLVLSRSATQEAALQSLLAAQQNPASPQYHRWLTPEQFAARFGVSDADLAAVENWLETKGFTVNSVARSRDRITFSGSATQVATAFGTSLHQYRSGSETNWAPSSDLSLPAALAPMVTAVQHLSTFRPKPRVRTAQVEPAYTSSVTGSHYLTPGDVATQYDVKPEYNNGFNGAGQSIAVAGQSYIETTDVQHFQSAAGLPSNLPNFVLIPNSGASAIYQGDESESDIDVEYTSGMAPGAAINFVYAGNSPNYSVFDAVTYAVTEDVAPVITLSYGSCEIDTSSSEVQQATQMGEQANAQGQTIIASTGDSGSTTCFGDQDLSLVEQETPAVDFPANVANITGLGGLQMAAGTFTLGNNTYFGTASGSDNISSLLSYVPEVVWNEDSTTQGIASGGGGSSTVVPRPTWQAGVPGIPSGAFRLLPDVALQASILSPGYLYCSSDPTAWQSGQSSSCTNGFRDTTSSGLLTFAGGTSFAAPIFGGLVAVLNQIEHSTGQGNINPTLYSLASNSATYASAFHDITSGNNECLAGPEFCSTVGASEYTAGVGYDEASGLGSIDFAKLVAAWPATNNSALAASTTTLTAATLTPASGASDLITINVASSSGGTPTGTVVLNVDGAAAAATLTLNNGQASYTYPGTAVGGTHVIAASYSGDSSHAASVSSISLTLAGTLIPTGTFSLTATPITFPLNGEGNSTVVITPGGGYDGTVNFQFSSSVPTNLCYAINSATVNNITQDTLTFGEGTTCTSSSMRRGTGGAIATPAKRASNNPGPKAPWRGAPATTVLAGLLACGLLTRRRARRLPSLLAMGLLSLVVGLGLTGCGGSTTTTPTQPTGPTVYTLTLVGSDSVTPSITSSTSLTVTVTQ